MRLPAWTFFSTRFLVTRRGEQDSSTFASSGKQNYPCPAEAGNGLVGHGAEQVGVGKLADVGDDYPCCTHLIRFGDQLLDLVAR